jgi:flagellar FliJ protein
MMFKFRLQKVLDLRARRVDQEALRLRGAIQALMQLAGEKEALQARIARLTKQAEQQRLAAQPLHLWTWQASYLEDQGRRLAAMRNSEQEAAEEVDRQREKLCAAQRQKEVLENLATRQRQQWLLEQSRRDRKELDEVGSIRAGNQGKA